MSGEMEMEEFRLRPRAERMGNTGRISTPPTDQEAHQAPTLPDEVQANLQRMREATTTTRQRLLTECVRAAAEQVLHGIHSPALQTIIRIVEEDQKTRTIDRRALDRTIGNIEKATTQRPSRAPWVITTLATLVALGCLALLLIQQIRPTPQPMIPTVAAAPASPASPTLTADQVQEIANRREDLGKVTALLEAKRAELTALSQDMAQKQKQTVDAVAALQAISEARAQAQTDMSKLEDLKQKHRAGLMPGKDGKLYAEVNEGATPFQYERRWYVELKSP